ncbi:MAG TPA: Hsp70 family protein, partial [Candidatus Kapabacteria bacterium]|nr:Hsp70 family protein [Candidatus Kapabacteria bacterium]
MKECCQCGQWKIKNTDDYCGYCGFLQLDISVEPRELALISEIVTDGKIVFRNNGIKDIEVEILPMEPAFEGLSFLPSNSFTLFKENSFEIKVLLDENKISDDMMVEKKKYICLIDKDKRKTIDLFIVLKGGPKAASLINEIRFGDVEEGKDAESWTEIINKGGIPLQIKDISLEGSDQFQIGLKEPLEQLDPGQKKKIPVIWKSPKFDPVLNTNKVGLRVQFKNSAKDLFIPIKGKLFKFQFGIEPAEIKINEALSKQAYSRKVTLTNNGTKDIEVMAIETDVEWIQIISKAANFTLLCRDSVTRNVAIGPTVYAESYTFEVVCFPKELNEGVQKAKVKVKTTKDDIFAEIDIQLYVIRPKECFDFIGIDFGTTNSVVAIWNDYEGDICLVEDENPYTKKRTPLIPSVLVFHGRPDNYKIGTEAEREAEVFADVSVRSIKRIMGYGNDRVFFEKKFSPEDLAALIIKKLIEYAEERLYNINKSRGGAY